MNYVKIFLSTIVITMSSSHAIAGENIQIKQGDYWVAVGQQLAEYALFPIAQISVRERDGKVEIKYDLPLELTGTLNKIEFEGVKPEIGAMILTGDYGRMECPAAEDLSNCAVFYSGLSFDAEARTALLTSIAKSDDELRKRELVAARFQFGGEPHGFLRVLP